MRKAVQQTFGFTDKASAEEKARRDRRKLKAVEYARAQDFVRWFIDAHARVLGVPVRPEPMQKATLAAKLMLDKIDAKEAKGRAAIFLRSRQRGARAAVSFFCFKGYADTKALHADLDAANEQAKIDRINAELQDARRGESQIIAGRLGGAPCSRSKRFEVGELEQIAAQLLAQNRTVPAGIKKRLQGSK